MRRTCRSRQAVHLISPSLRAVGTASGVGCPFFMQPIWSPSPPAPRARAMRGALRPPAPAKAGGPAPPGPLLGRGRPRRRPRALAQCEASRARHAGPGTPGRFTDAATAQHGDPLDIIRHRTRAPTLRVALDEARSFLALPAAPATGEPDSYDVTEGARHLWRRCRAIDGTLAERYLHARGLARCRFAARRSHPALRYREGASVQPCRRWSPP